MTADKDTVPPKTRLFRNWLSLAGAVLSAGAFFAFLLLFAIDTFARVSNPYLGILAYVVAPGFLFMGFGLIGAGAWIQRRHERGKPAEARAHRLSFDSSDPADRKRMRVFLFASAIFLLCTAIGSYESYQVSESVQFCGQACHTPMKPEFVAYQNSPHARVACVECHVGHGADAFVKAKLNGVHQLLGVITGDYDRPIKTPVRNLRPARETCERCHWPEKFSGNIDRTYQHFLADETNTPFAVRLTLNVGGADGTHGPIGGIHWHVNASNKIEYLATDDRRQVLPWVRVTNPKGVVTEFRSPKFTNDIAAFEIRTMDCIDCHNRPAHRYRTPNEAVDAAMSRGGIDRTLPWVKSNVVAVLSASYGTEDEALTKISAALRSQYASAPGVEKLVKEAQTVYAHNLFPEMKADWRAYPENIGHKDWPGCFRCHDGSHKSTDGKLKIPASDCTSCHTILAQGAGAELEKLNPKGSAFIHIDAEYENFDCASCHTGAFPK